jgi:hypothetical protein
MIRSITTVTAGENDAARARHLAAPDDEHPCPSLFLQERHVRSHRGGDPGERHDVVQRDDEPAHDPTDGEGVKASTTAPYHVGAPSQMLAIRLHTGAMPD